MTSPRLFALDTYKKSSPNNNFYKKLGDNLTEQEIDSLIAEAGEKRDEGDSGEAINMYLSILTCVKKTSELTDEQKFDKIEKVSALSYLAMTRRIQAP